MSSGCAGGLSVTLCRDPRQFAALEESWNRLFRGCPTATPFQSHAWLHSWWLSYGKDGRLRIVLVRRGEELVGAAALMLVHRPMPLLVPLGGPITDYFDVLVAAEYADQVVPALARGLHRAARGAVVDLREVRPGAAAEQLYRQWPGVSSVLADSTCMELPTLPFDELVKRMPPPEPSGCGPNCARPTRPASRSTRSPSRRCRAPYGPCCDCTRSSGAAAG